MKILSSLLLLAAAVIAAVLFTPPGSSASACALFLPCLGVFALLPTVPAHPNTSGVRTNDSIKEVALPAANASANTPALDLGGDPTVFGAVLPNLKLQLRIPALPALTDNSKTLTVTVQDSADNSSWATAAGYGNITIAGVTTTGPTASAITLAIHPHTRRYIRFNIAIPTGGGDNTGVTATAALLM